jgi:hypothetical protein
MRAVGFRQFYKAAITVALLAGLGCNGFGTGNSTQPGNTPPTSSQSSYRFLGNIGTPFVATVTDARSSWVINGVVPLTVLLVNVPLLNGQSGPTRVIATKLTNDPRLLSVELINGFSVQQIASTNANYGLVVANFGARLNALAPPASPDVRFFVKGPATATFNATVEDLTVGYALQSRAPTIILYDMPNGGSQSDRVDGIFSIVQLIGPMSIDLSFNGRVVHAGGSAGTIAIKIN